MTIVITGATGKLGRNVLQALLDSNVPATEIVAAGRSIEKLEDFATQGVRVAAMDYDDPASVAAALTGATKVLLIASSEVCKDRPGQHRTVIEAAKAEGVELLAYTSNANADINSTILGQDHKTTEAILADAGVPYTLLRNGYYFENWTEQLQGTLAQGVLMGAGGNGQVNAATRRDLAEAAVAVLLGENQAGKVYELGGDAAFTMADFAAEITAVTGTTVVYKDLPAAEYVGLLTSFGIPEAFAGILADADQGLARGELLVQGNDLRTLIGRPTTTPADAVRAAVAAS
ncbi:nucleoside-diphosphate sugar epimerase [Arthrobacter sp. ERGS1:01]|uniref:SDR family oxidoreductase n=1 Tax=Arthrobacter sp. ERGS1:01 TaxID=1704044 RepID=UPI0006B46A37|nr:SDR family oxidoreductase [Arthrobacter sp. ERGS1:01]ALE06265.1 nucleoside-diphosphate sugar epimerase [Arthrobacter sp. ERGS1:01]